MSKLHVKRLFSEPKQSYFLLGPRGTGKSTLIAHLHPNALRINLLIASTRNQYLARPEILLNVVRAESPDRIIFIDEIQLAPELLMHVHLLIEEKKGWTFILTGSSARKLKQENVDLLGGRALKKTLHPFIAAELAEHFNFEDALQYGLLPLRYASKEPLETLSSYISLYLDQEVKAEGLVRRIEPFARFLETLSFSHGSLLNMSNVSRECSVKYPTVTQWLLIAEDLLFIFKISVFTRRAKRILVAQSKLYFFDTGVFRALRPKSILDSQSEIEGGALEGLVAQHLRAWIDYTKQSHELYFWRTKSGVEVDFVVFGEMGLWAIEVKNSRHIRPSDLTSLRHFKEDYPEATLIFLYRGEERMQKGDILCIPCADFLKNIVPNKEL